MNKQQVREKTIIGREMMEINKYWIAPMNLLTHLGRKTKVKLFQSPVGWGYFKTILITSNSV